MAAPDVASCLGQCPELGPKLSQTNRLRNPVPTDMGMGQVLTRGPQVLVLGSTYQGSMLGTHF